MTASAGSYGPQGTIGGSSQPVYSGPGNIVGGAKAWWGLRGYSSAYSTGSNPSVQILRQSDSTTATINILASGLFDTATALSFCNGTICSVKTLYDQTGNGYNLTQPTASKQPILIFSCLAFAPCLGFFGSPAEYLTTTSFASLSQPYSISSVVARVGNYTGENDLVTAVNGSNVGSVVGFYAATNTASTYGGSATNQWTNVPDNVLHAMMWVVNGASSTFYFDQSSATTGTNVGSASTYSTLSVGGNSIGNSHYLTGQVTEIGIWPIGISSAQAANVIANQQANWR